MCGFKAARGDIPGRLWFYSTARTAPWMVIGMSNPVTPKDEARAITATADVKARLRLMRLKKHFMSWSA